MLSTLWVQKNLNFLGYNAGPEDNVNRTSNKGSELSNFNTILN